MKGLIEEHNKELVELEKKYIETLKNYLENDNETIMVALENTKD